MTDHECQVIRVRLRKTATPQYAAVCVVCGRLAKPYDDEDVAKRRAMLHVQAWASLPLQDVVEHAESCL